ncbi:MAG TPA: hypothetical protein VGY58_14100 [Gemmataceae bacterium]|jgi:hypothetical protein|nr:hypothetical protein [Gemmataceae bacterium]
MNRVSRRNVITTATGSLLTVAAAATAARADYSIPQPRRSGHGGTDPGPRKLQRARIQARDAAALEFTKPAYILQTSKHELRVIAAAFDGARVRRIAGEPPRQHRSRSYGDGTRRGSILTADVYANESRLVPCRRSEVSNG